MRISKESEPISRVKCCVDTCEYWESGDQCLASSIEIQPPMLPIRRKRTVPLSGPKASC